MSVGDMIDDDILYHANGRFKEFQDREMKSFNRKYVTRRKPTEEEKNRGYIGEVITVDFTK